ncbi:hypothetical protein AB0M22_19855 [Nocardia sp. NPDC051756]|uniref:hypothetical protein n=1 Tax=Nocardia sp. NPDC051756 TaxID=3154751 RepID=UPI003416767D
MAFSANELTPVDAIPVPPFANQDQARTFVRMLMVYVAHLREGSRVELTQFALGDVLEREYEMLARRWQPYPSDTVLRIAMDLRFPAPWTPHGLVDAFVALGWRPWADSGGATATALGYRSDPDFEAERRPDGGWEMTWIERGMRRSGGDAANDYGMVMVLMGA